MRRANQYYEVVRERERERERERRRAQARVREIDSGEVGHAGGSHEHVMMHCAVQYVL